MLMPKAPMNEDDLATWAKYQIGLAGKPSTMKPVAIAHPVHQPPDNHLRLHVLGLDRRHVGTAAGFGQLVCQYLK